MSMGRRTLRYIYTMKCYTAVCNIVHVVDKGKLQENTDKMILFMHVHIIYIILEYRADT